MKSQKKLLKKDVFDERVKNVNSIKASVLVNKTDYIAKIKDIADKIPSITINLATTVVVVITTTRLHSTKAELRFCAGSNNAHDVFKICDGDKFSQWSWLQIKHKCSP